MRQTYAGILLLSVLIILAACNGEASEGASSENSNETENGENTSQEDDLADNESPIEDESSQEQSHHNNGNSEDNGENDANDEMTESEPGIYDPKEVSGREDPEGDGNIVYPEALENLSLPYIYENTLVYSGTINPDQDIRFELPSPDSDDTEVVDLDVSDTGHFAIPLGGTDLEAGDELVIYVMGNMPHEQQFILPIQPSEEGMELVENPSDTAAGEEIKEATYLPEFYENTSTYYGKTLPGVDVSVSETDAFIGQTEELENDENGDFSGDFSNFPYNAKGEAGLQEGQHLYFTFTDEAGNVALSLIDILPPSDEPNYDGPVSETD